MRTVSAPPEETALPFPSLSALRSVHSDLLKRQQAGGGSPDLLDAAEAFVCRGRETGALLDSQDDRWSAQSALDYWASFLYRTGRREVDSTLAEFDPALVPALDDALCPYIGLEAFREGQHELFFGRSRLIGEMVSRLRESRLLAVLGPSGSGKSSLVLGGLLPELKAGALPGSEGWRYIPPLVPGSEPLRNLARALMPEDADPNTWISRHAETLERDPEHLARLLAGQGGAPAVLVVDQFEEVFTLCEPRRIRQAFIAGLVHLLRPAALGHRVVLTMRSDYEEFIPRLEDLQPYFEGSQIRVTPLSAAELRDAIEKPAEKIGLKFEEGLVPALLQDLLGEPAGLPLLQFTLLKLWERRERNRVTWAAYRRLGGGRLALARSADELYEKLIEEDQRAARRILLRMVRPGSGLEVTSNRIRRASLQGIGEDPGRIDRVLDKLVEGRLVRLTQGETPNDTQVEVAHEALVRNWPRLVDWLEKARAEITTRRRLEAQAAEWVRLGCGPGGLLDAVQLADAERWLASPEAEDLGSDQQLAAFVAASRQEVDRTIYDHLWKSRLKWAFGITVVLCLLTMAFLGRETRRSQEARQLRDQARKEAINAEDAKTQAVTEKNRAEGEKIRAESEKRRADELATKAQEAQIQAEHERQRALQALREARVERANAQHAARDANAGKQEAIKQKLEAEKQKLEADAAKLELERDKGVIKTTLDIALEQTKQAQKALADLEDQKKIATGRRQELESMLATAGNKQDDSVQGMLTKIWSKSRSFFQLSRYRERNRPVRIGTSIGLFGKGSPAGTICCLVSDPAGKYLLSLRPVLASGSDARIIQPSREDSGEDKDVVARYNRSGADPNKSGAIARLNPGIAVNLSIPKVGRIQGTGEVQIGDTVLLVGRGSGLQKGSVVAFDERNNIVTDIIPAYGDKGAPLLTMDNKLVGLLWGWKPTGPSYAVPIMPVLKELNVELVVELPSPSTHSYGVRAHDRRQSPTPPPAHSGPRTPPAGAGAPGR